MPLADVMNQINSRFMGDKRNVNDLSPVSVLRLNFDNLKSETTDPEPDATNVFGVPVRQLVPQRVISWIGNSTKSNFDVEVISNASATNNNGQMCISSKV